MVTFFTFYPHIYNYWDTNKYHQISTSQGRFSVPQEKTKGMKAHKQAAVGGGCIEDLTKHLQGEISEYGDVHWCRVSFNC